MKLSDLKHSKPPKIILYGPAGTGKTVFVTSAGEKLHLIDLDEGLLSAVSVKDNWSAERLKVDVKQFLEPDPARKAVAFQQVKQYIYSLGAEIQSKRFPYQILCIDSLTKLAELSVNAVMANSGRLGQNPEIQHWGLAFTEIKNVMTAIKALPIPVVLIAHEQTKTVNEEDRIEISVPGKNLYIEIPAFFDEVWYMRAKPAGGGKIDYLLQTSGNSRLRARSRACLADMTNTNIGFLEVLKKLGYDPTTKTP